MAYFEGTLSGTQTGLTVMAAIKTALDGNLPTGWSYVEEYTESSTTWHVYKCDKTETGLPNDFHVILLDTEAGSNTLHFWICEDYDTTNHRMIRPHLNYGSGTQTLTPPSDGLGGAGDDATLYRPTTTTVVRTAGTGLNSNVSAAWRCTVSAVDAWAVIVYQDSIVISLKAGNAAFALFAGKFITLVKDAATNDPMPVGMTAFSNNFATQSTYAVNFNSVVPTRSAMNANVQHTPRLRYNKWHGLLIQSNVTTTSTHDKYSAVSGGYLEPLMIVNGRIAENASTSSTQASTSGFLRGRIPYILEGLGGSWGDTVTIGSETYQAISFNSYWALREDLGGS